MVRNQALPRTPLTTHPHTRDTRPSAGNDTGLQQKNDTPQPTHQQKHLLKTLSPTTANHTSRISSSKVGEVTAGAFVQDLLGLPAAVRGTTRLTLDSFYNTVLALRQRTIASDFLGGVPDASRVLVMEVILGLWNEDLAGLEKNASETETQYRAARTALSQFKKLRDSGALTDPDATRAEYEQKVREHEAASKGWQKAAGVLTEVVGELGRLTALYKAAEQHRRKAARQADAVQAKLSGAKADLARAEGARDALLVPSQKGCTLCEQRLPERAPGHCPQCGQSHPEGENRRVGQLAAASAKVDRLRLKVRELEDVVTAAVQVAADGEQAAARALADRDAFEEQRLAPARSAACCLPFKMSMGLSLRMSMWGDENALPVGFRQGI